MEKFSAIDVAALFKNWLKILPKALISSELYDMFYDDSSVIIRSDTCIIAKINKITEEMNPLYSYVLRFLVKFIKKMCLQDIMAKTKMNKLNYSIVLSPNIFQSHKMVRNSDNIFRTTNQINMFNSLIAHCDVSDIEWPVIKYNISNHL
ncbi:hypothetical protein A3Q56_06602 [Intoshia linei]|uniref:Rho-GAP domain-containing protein n=1 Tax=Intoshia linei TaxID=1819745 RepID=A0A177AWU6_9BILA|nr:hypothetical protein A3Q56_06602 [Intoshia linei]